LPAREASGLDVSAGDWVRSVAFSPDGGTLLTGGGEPGKRGAGRLWDARTGRGLGTAVVSADLIWAVAFSPHNRTIATAGADGRARLADARTGQAGAVLRHSGPIYFVAFGPTGELVLTGSDDGTAQLWDAKTGRRIGSPLPHGAAVLTGGFNR